MAILFLFQILTVQAQNKLVAVELYTVYVPPVGTVKYLVLFCLRVHFCFPKQRLAPGFCHVDGLFPVKWKLNFYVFLSVSFGLEPGKSEA
jgi:hypothetical protein